MKYIPLNFSPNVSSSGTAISPSLKIDDRGFPHLSWIDRNAEQNRINYAFWDGSKWSYKDIPEVSISNGDINCAPNSLILDTDYNPHVVFSNRAGVWDNLSLANYNGGWDFVSFETDFEVGWVGIGMYGREGLYSSSSSSSSTVDIGSSSSGSSNSSSSMSSSSFSSSSSDHSDSYSSWSSLSDSFTSSSSSSYDDGIFFATVYDITNSMFKIYSVAQSWRLVASMPATLDSYSSIRSLVYDRMVGIAYIDANSQIKYNIFDLYNNVWSFGSFSPLVASQSYGSVIEMDIAGYNQENECIILFGWLSRTTTDFYVHSVLAYFDGTEIPSDYVSQIVEISEIDVDTNDEYIVNGYKKIAVCLNNYLPNIIVGGISFKTFSIIEASPSVRSWQESLANVDCISNGAVIGSLRSEFYTDIKMAFLADSGDIYYLEPDVLLNTFDVSTPDVIIAGEPETHHGTYNNGLISNVDIAGMNNNHVGKILKDSQRPLLVSSNRTSNEVIKSGDIEKNIVISNRDILSYDLVRSIDVDQISGNILISKPSENIVVIYSQNEMPVTINRFNIIGSLLNPLDARFDFIRSRIWIADTGNDRVIGLDTNINLVDAQTVISNVIYPHVLCANLNNGGVFIKGYVDELMTQGIVCHYDNSGSEISSFIFDIQESGASSSSSSESDIYPELPIVHTMSYDHVRNKIWWIDKKKIYVADEGNKQVQVYSINYEGFYDTRSIDIELATGNAFVVAKDIHNWFLLQISKDNKEVIAQGYLL